MVWTESNDIEVATCIKKLENKANILNEKLAKINNLRKIAGNIKTRTMLVEKEPDKEGKIKTEKQIIKPKDDFGIELTDSYKLEQLSKLVTATDEEIGD